MRVRARSRCGLPVLCAVALAACGSPPAERGPRAQAAVSEGVQVDINDTTVDFQSQIETLKTKVADLEKQARVADDEISDMGDELAQLRREIRQTYAELREVRSAEPASAAAGRPAP